MDTSQTRGDFIPCNLYVDGENIRIHLRERGLSTEFDPTKLRELVADQWLAGRRLSAVRVFFYDTIDQRAPEHEQHRERDYLERVEQLPDTRVTIGSVVAGRKQKGVDVQLAVDALEAAWSDRIGAVAIASGDGDFVPLVAAIRRAGPHVLILSFANDLSGELRDAADRLTILPDRPVDWGFASGPSTTESMMDT